MTPNENNINSNDTLSPDANDTMYAKWKCDGLIKMKEKARYNVSHRSNTIRNVVSEIVCKLSIANRNRNVSNLSQFMINDEFEESALNKLFTKFEEWTGVNINACKSGIVDWSEYWDRADNWLNRNKGAWFGDYYFYPIFNTHLKQYCNDIADIMHPHHMEKKECFYAFIYAEILKHISSENIRFKQTRPQSLVIDQSLIQSNLLQNFLIKYSASHGITWILPKAKSAKLYRESWRQCMDSIHKKTYSMYCRSLMNVSRIKSTNNIQRNEASNKSLYTSSIVCTKPQLRFMANNNNNNNILRSNAISSPVHTISAAVPAAAPTVTTYYLVPMNYGAVHHNNASYVANRRFHPFASTNYVAAPTLNHNRHNNDYQWLINAVLVANNNGNQNNINLNQFRYMQ